MRILLCFGVILGGMAVAQPPASFDPSAIDKTANPCQDFYQFACGGWMANNPIPSDQSRWGRFDQLQDSNRELLRKMLEAAAQQRTGRSAAEQKMGDYYAACMDEKAIAAKGAAPVKLELERLAALKDKSGLADLMVYLYLGRTAPFFRFASGPDAKNSTQVIADLDQGGLGLPERDYYFRTDEKSEDLRKKYVAHVQKMLELAGISMEEAAKRAQAVMTLETALAKASLDRVSRRDPEKLYHKMTLKELDALAPNFAWGKFFDGLGAPKFVSLNVEVPDFMKALDQVISSTSLDDLKAYLSWNLLHDSAEQLSAPFEQENFNFYRKTLSGTQEMRPRWKRCVDLADRQLPDAVGRKFTETTLGPEGIKRTREMVGEIEKSMERDLKSLDWMTGATKDQAFTKLHEVMNKIGTNDKWESYAKVKIAPTDFYGNAERAGAFELSKTLAKIGKPVDKKDWDMSQPTVNAYYDAQQNNINFPAGILQPPFFDNKQDDAVNYGAIGAVIGHELTHGFDDQGRQFDAKGNLRDWWTEADSKAFDQRAQCLIDQYSNYTAVDDVKLNGKLTLGENTADNGGHIWL
jgi:endothelin-converting enzyme/putative endopeptidase